MIQRHRKNIPELVKDSGLTRRSLHHWFVLLKGRPSATATLAALGWAEAQTRKRRKIFYPTWEELKLSVGCLPQGTLGLSDLARASKMPRQRISDYFGKGGQIEADGETALLIYDLLLHRFLYFDVEEKLEDFAVKRGLRLGHRYVLPKDGRKKPRKVRRTPSTR